MKRIATLILFLGWALSALAQNVTLKGIVTDAAGEPVIGAFVLQQGTSNGTSTGVDGEFSLATPQGAAIEVSCIGYTTQVITNNGAQNLVVVLQDDTQMLEETVVIGYGVQKKSVVTAAIAKVDSEALEKTGQLRVDSALKGLAAGVNVTSGSGQPGAESRIRIRGTGTVNNSNPLYIVDGMPIGIEGIDYLNPSDIESIEVLKDAASGAVYGARAANGVILVTTKKGAKGAASVAYNFTYGLSSPWRLRSVLNASEYALLTNEGLINAGEAPIYADPFSYGVGTDWQKEVFNFNAPQQQHELSISGASDRFNYYISAGYVNQEGIVGGNFGRSNYQRLSLRSNTTFTVWDNSDERSFLNKFTLGSNLSFSNINSTSIDPNNQFNTVVTSALAMSPILGVYANETQQADQLATYGDLVTYGANGKMFTIPGSMFNDMINPVAMLSLPGEKYWTNKFVAGFSAELQIWDNLRFRSTLGFDMGFYGNDGYSDFYYLSPAVKNDEHTSVWSGMNRNLTWQVENVLTYDKTLGDHSFSVLLGQSASAYSGYSLGGSRWHVSDFNKPSIDYSTGLQANGEMGASGGPHDPARLASYFFRASYNYAERYMAQVTVREDGSSRFGPRNKWALFPSFSLGWNLHREPYLQDVKPDWLSNAKLRFSWGKNGNEAIGNFRYTNLTASGENNAILGNPGHSVIGQKAAALSNPSLRWETSTQTDVGLDLGFFNNALTFTVDWYQKITDGMLMEMRIPSYVGESKPIGNVGIMSNSGLEFELGYKHSVGDFNFRVNANATYLRNRLIEYGNETGFEELQSFQGTGTILRAANGMPFPYFYGYKTDGIFQNMGEVNSYTATVTDADGNTVTQLIQPTAVPGDVRFVDINHDGAITEADRTDIGNGTPDWTWGINLGFDFKGFDFSMLWQGTVGNDIFDATRRIDVRGTNQPEYILGRWTGEGTSNKYPRFIIGDKTNNWLSSDLYVCDGSYARLKNIQLGYTLPRKFTEKFLVASLRLFVAAENLVTLTSYRGFDPEISSGSASSLGVDYGVYPQARTFSAGVNIKFGRSRSASAAPAAPAHVEPYVVEKVVEKEVVKEVPVIKEVIKEVPVSPVLTDTYTDDLYFVIGKAELRPEEAFKLGQMAQILKENPDATIQITGYADSATGTAEKNKTLSSQRAQTVVDMLQKAGVSASRITSASAVDRDSSQSPESNRVAVCIVK